MSQILQSQCKMPFHRLGRKIHFLGNLVHRLPLKPAFLEYLTPLFRKSAYGRRNSGIKFERRYGVQDILGFIHRFLNRTAFPVSNKLGTKPAYGLIPDSCQKITPELSGRIETFAAGPEFQKHVLNHIFSRIRVFEQ